MQKRKAAASPPAMILQNRAPQQNARELPPSQQRSDDDNPGQVQPYQLRRTENRWVRQGERIQIGSEEEQKMEMPPGQTHQNLVMQQMPGPPQGQPRLPNQQPFYPNQRPMRIPRHQPQNNQPMYSSPPGGPPMAVQMIGPPDTTQFMPPGQHPPFMTQPVDFSLPMGNPAKMQYHRPQKPMQGQFSPVSGPSQPQGSPYFQPTTVYQVGQPTPPMYIVRAPPGPMTGMPQYQTQTFEPRTRERKIIQIMDPNSNKDVTQEILNRHPSGSLTGSTGGTPNNITPDISGQSSSSSTPPLTLQQQAEASVRAQVAAQVAGTLANSEDKPKKPEVIIQKAPVNNKVVVDTVQLKETTVTQKNEVVKETRTNLVIGLDTQLLPEANVGAQFAAQTTAKGELEREMTEVHCDESEISVVHLEDLSLEDYIRLPDLKTQLIEMKKQLGIKDNQLRVKDEQQHTLQEQLNTLRAEKEKQEKENAKLQDQLCEKLKDFSELEKEHRDSLQDQVDLENELEEANKKIFRYESQLMTRDWIISRDEIEIMFDNCLGYGGYGTVYRGRYRGFVVAVKTLKAFSLNSGERGLFEREMDIASRCRHPCLLQFIGATQEENPLFVTELMESSLRKLINQRRLAKDEIVVISLDVAHALNYLHNRKPSPLVHRDVSSANVLLWKQNNQWRGKLGDYGTVKFLQEIMTISPGAMIYSAPEAGSPHNQTVKIDVYSFGVLLCEMFTGKLPVFEERKKHVALVPNRPSREFRDLVLRCTEEDPKERPSMEKVIKKLEKFKDSS